MFRYLHLLEHGRNLLEQNLFVFNFLERVQAGVLEGGTLHRGLSEQQARVEVEDHTYQSMFPHQYFLP
jgi:hypothetical protein